MKHVTLSQNPVSRPLTGVSSNDTRVSPSPSAVIVQEQQPPLSARSKTHLSRPAVCQCSGPVRFQNWGWGPPGGS